MAKAGVISDPTMAASLFDEPDIARANRADSSGDARESARLIAESTAYLANAQRNLETAFMIMSERQQKGEKPASFAVEAAIR